MPRPTVSFVVPCYKLAHLLAECVTSILSQSFTDLEVIIMDDCSPDNTEEIARSFTDPRLKYVRNESNLGHLRNYNKGIGLSKGKYIWLISADDRLRRVYAVERYVELMDAHPEVGYVFSPGIGLVEGVETKVLETYYYGQNDRIFDGRRFIADMIRTYRGIISASVMVRRECYRDISMFPLDLPHQGDLYLWIMWALEFDVAYLSDPMVNYRSHDLNMMKFFMQRQPETIFNDEVNVLWRTKNICAQKGFGGLARLMEHSIASKYSAAAAHAVYGQSVIPWGMSIEECRENLRANSLSDFELKRIRSNFYASLADRHLSHSDLREARRSYTLAICDNRRDPRLWVKLLLALMGRFGMGIRNSITQLKTGRGAATAPSADSFE